MSNELSDHRSVTCQMIADMAQVSRATVRRVMHNEPYVKEDVRQRVSQIIEKYHYKPNTAGLALVSQRSDIKLGVISLSATDALYEELNNGSKQAAADYHKYGVEIIFRFVNDTSDGVDVVDAIDDLVAQGIRGLAIMGVDIAQVREKLCQIQDNVPIVTYNTEISGVKELCYVGQDPIKCGRTAANLMNGLLCGHGNVIIIANTMNVSAVAKRVQGFREWIQNHETHLCIAELLENNSSNTRSYELLKTLFAHNREVQGIYIACGFGSKGVCAALDECGMQHVRVVAHDMLPYTVKNLLEGKIDFSIDQELFRQGYLPVEILAKHVLMKEDPEFSRIYTKIDIKTSENL